MTFSAYDTNKMRNYDEQNEFLVMQTDDYENYLTILQVLL